MQDEEPNPIRLIEAEVALDLLERFRCAANVGSRTLASFIEIEAAKVSSAGRFKISKSMLDSWRAGRSVPGSAHLTTLVTFFRSQRFKRIVPNAEYLWDSLRATTDLGLQLMRWEGLDGRGSTVCLDGLWIDGDSVDPESANREDRRIFLRVANVAGYSFSVAHILVMPFGKSEIATSKFPLDEVSSGYVFCRGDDFLMILRRRFQRGEETRFDMRKIDPEPGGDIQLHFRVEKHGDRPPHTPSFRPWVRDVRSDTPDYVLKLFDSILWSVLPNG